MIKKFDDLTVVEFGNGTVTVELGKYGSQYAVFINNTDTPGMPGQLAPKTKNPRGYEPDEIVLVFPTKKRAAGVVNSLFNGELVKVEGRQHPAPAVQGEPVAWMHSDPGRVDVIHDKVRKLLKDSSDNAGYLHRPLDKSERYTIPLYTAPQPAEQQPSAHWSHDNPGLADQYRGEAMAARRSVGFKQDADDVSPTDISAAIESLTRTAAPAVQMEVVGWQFYLDGKWWNGDDRIKDHKRNTQEAGYRIRDVYAFSDGPTLVEECPLVETLESIAEYWNQDGNEDAMLNACEYTRSAALAALAAYRKQGDGQ